MSGAEIDAARRVAAFYLDACDVVRSGFPEADDVTVRRVAARLVHVAVLQTLLPETTRE